MISIEGSYKLLKKVARGEMNHETVSATVKELVGERPIPLREERSHSKGIRYSLEYGTAIYGALFIALRVELKAELITSDRNKSLFLKGEAHGRSP
ncbi:MAG: hypothetical protein QE164_02785 [Candidatus Nezhaarchaeota archaeon]|nr:hypothetical protein [Candidatus Nezhaarchaeota archaeon]